MIDEWLRRITHVVESLAKFYEWTSDEALKCEIRKKSAWFINVAVQQRPNFNKKHHSDELLTLPNLTDLWSRSDEVNMRPFWEKKADRKNKISIGSFLTKHGNNVWNVISVLLRIIKYYISYNFRFSYNGRNDDNRGRTKEQHSRMTDSA